MLYKCIPCPIEYLLCKYGYSDILPIVKPLRLSNNNFVFMIPHSIGDIFIEMLREVEICEVTYIVSEEIDILNLANKHIDVRLGHTHCDNEYFIATPDDSTIHDSIAHDNNTLFIEQCLSHIICSNV